MISFAGIRTIGTGDYAALSSLYQRAYSSEMTVTEALYYVHEAKVAAERASGVGQSTHLLLLRKGHEHGIYAGAEDLEALREIRDQLKPRDLTKENRELLKKLPIVRRFQDDAD